MRKKQRINEMLFCLYSVKKIHINAPSQRLKLFVLSDVCSTFAKNTHAHLYLLVTGDFVAHKPAHTHTRVYTRTHRHTHEHTSTKARTHAGHTCTTTPSLKQTPTAKFACTAHVSAFRQKHTHSLTRKKNRTRNTIPRTRTHIHMPAGRQATAAGA